SWSRLWRYSRAAHIDRTISAFLTEKILGHALDESGKLLVFGAADDGGLAEHQGLIFVVEIKRDFSGDEVTSAEQALLTRHGKELADAAARIGIKGEMPLDAVMGRREGLERGSKTPARRLRQAHLIGQITGRLRLAKAWQGILCHHRESNDGGP